MKIIKIIGLIGFGPLSPGWMAAWNAVKEVPAERPMKTRGVGGSLPAYRNLLGS